MIKFFILALQINYSVFSSDTPLDSFGVSTQYLSGKITEEQMTDFLKNKLIQGFTEEEHFLILDALNKKPIHNPELQSMIQAAPTSVMTKSMSELPNLKPVIPIDKLPVTKKKELNPWVTRIALSLAVGFFIAHSAQKTLVIDSNPFN
ncbi:MAG: hypothetical protein ACK5V3_14230 [Bdellovibrionales bacterium]